MEPGSGERICQDKTRTGIVRIDRISRFKDGKGGIGDCPERSGLRVHIQLGPVFFLRRPIEINRFAPAVEDRDYHGARSIANAKPGDNTQS